MSGMPYNWLPVLFCNACGQAVSQDALTCDRCGAKQPELPPIKGMPAKCGDTTGGPSASPLTFGAALHFYLEMGNELYEAKARGDDSEMTVLMQKTVDSLRASIEGVLDARDAHIFRAAVRDELALEKRTLWLRRITAKLKATKPGLLSLELLGSAGIVAAVAYCVVHLDSSLALLCGIALIALRLMLPWGVGLFATNEERKLRELRLSVPAPHPR